MVFILGKKLRFGVDRCALSPSSRNRDAPLSLIANSAAIHDDIAVLMHNWQRMGRHRRSGSRSSQMRR